jgi:hypothetical protein
VSQLRLPGLDVPTQVHPAADRTAPALWIRRMLIARELSSSPEHVVRDITLRRGLNIIWTPPRADHGANALFRSGAAGHTAGKTTLCRLIRYVLGEDGFGTKKARKRIREEFPNGWVLAEVELETRSWSVARPFAIGPHPLCVEGGKLEDLIVGGDRKDYSVFLNAVASVTLSELPSKSFPTTEAPLLWGHVLQWLSRDQECRFADFLGWRHSASDAESPSLDVEERQFVVRSVLGLVSDAEREELLRNTQLLGQKKEAERLAPLLAHQARVDHQRVEEVLGVSVALGSTDLFGSETVAELRRQRARVDANLLAAGAADPRPRLREALDHAIELETNARRDLDDVQARLASEKGALDVLKAPKGQNASLLAQLPPPSGYCNVPISLARDQGCPIATSRPIELAARRSERSAQDELVALETRIGALVTMEGEKQESLTKAAQGTSVARRSIFAGETRFEEERGPLLDERARLAQIERLARDAERAWASSKSHEESAKSLQGEIHASYVKQEEIRQQGRAAMAHLSSTFDYVVRAVYGDEVRARVDASGRSLALVVEHQGERESAALATVKLLAFDLAALTESVQGRGSFPRFLLHDGPREADMAPDIFERLFLFVRQLEACFSGEPGFQYVVTTTSRPPEELLSDPWLRLMLSGVPAEQRLLRCDL